MDLVTTDLVTQFEYARRLERLMQSVGFAVWQLQELETTVAAYLVIRVQAHRGIGRTQGGALLKQAEGRTLGSLLKELASSGVLEDRLVTDLQQVLEFRNWLVHRARRENRGILVSEERLNDLMQQLESVADRSLGLLKMLGAETERYVLENGVDRAIIDCEADRLARSWGLID
ncbi:MAG: hypothetical protein WA188_15465 [Terriglobales bacterium]